MGRDRDRPKGPSRGHRARVFGHGDLILRKTWTSICERYATLNDALVLRLVKVDLFFLFE